MAVTGTYTNRDLITDAYRKIGVVAQDEPMDADTAQAGMRALDRLLKSWQNHGYQLWATASQSIVLTTAAAQVLSPVRPLRIYSARLVQTGGNELPMCELTRSEYDRLPNKTTTGTPTQFYYDRQRESALFYVWPLDTTGRTVNITYEREMEDQTDLEGTPDVPGEWWDALVYGLAARLADDFARNKPMVVQRAERELDLALSMDREGSVYFVGDEYNYHDG